MSHHDSSESPLYTCHCNKSFTSFSALNGHKRAHSELKSINQPLRCCCIFTKKEMAVQYLENYQKSIKHCINCNAMFKPNEPTQKLCGQSCSASYSNKQKGQKSNKTKEKISESLKKYHKSPEKIGKNSVDKKVKPEIVGEFCKIFSCKCAHCDMLFTNRTRVKYCTLCSNHYSESNKAGYKFKFNVYHYPELFDLELLQEVGWFAPKGKSGAWNINGLSRDHKVSVNDAIANNYDPYYISHPLNCELMPHTINNKKKTRSSITYDELVKQVIEFDNKNRKK